MIPAGVVVSYPPPTHLGSFSSTTVDRVGGGVGGKAKRIDGRNGYGRPSHHQDRSSDPGQDWKEHHEFAVVVECLGGNHWNHVAQQQQGADQQVCEHRRSTGVLVHDAEGIRSTGHGGDIACLLDAKRKRVQTPGGGSLTTRAMYLRKGKMLSIAGREQTNLEFGEFVQCSSSGVVSWMLVP
jgi:hypothetical protein